MDQQTPIEDKKSFLRNDSLLVCGMLTFYGVCILVLIGAAIWGLDRRNQKISADATSTAHAAATQHAKATATAMVRATEQAQYEVIDPFDTNKRDWRVGAEDNEYWSGDVSVKQGVYLWDVKKSKKGFISRAEFSENEFIYDFDVYVDTKVEGKQGDVCSGLTFREASLVDEHYYFVLCNNAVAEISFYSAKGEWDRLATIPSFSSFSYSEDWNRLEISARGSHFTFFVNGSKIYEMSDERRKTGGIALVIEVTENTSARVLFDNFGLQYR
ncbi:MAG TPA: family 16 glycoside hydrolase [Anaerolineales bacterium]|nr:family 16 glycoside hydrolase [Anaerolineales bacterium]